MLTELALWFQMVTAQPQILGARVAPLAVHSISLDNRYDNAFVNGVFKDNILLTIRYLENPGLTKEQIDWDEVNQPFHSEFTLESGQAFAFHETTLPDYSQNVVKTTNAHFNGSEGFKSDGNLIGDGVCHLASLLFWVAQDAGLTAYAPSNHNFAKINEVPKEYGVAILSPDPLGNLYIVNSLDRPVSFNFDWDGAALTISAFAVVTPQGIEPWFSG